MTWHTALLNCAFLLSMLLLATLFGVAASSRALACACCTETGFRNVDVVSFDSGKREEVARVEFANPAQLYVGAGGLEVVEGIQNPTERYEMKVIWGQDGLGFGFHGNQGFSGTLSLPFPEKISIFEVDTRNSPDQGTGPVLYKEWKLIGKAAGTGAFDAANDAEQSLTLVLQGRGNACTSGSDFTHWTLVMEGPKANYSLFGDLVRTP